MHSNIALPFKHVAKFGKNHVTDGAEILFRFIPAELEEYKFSVPHVSRSSDHYGSLLPQTCYVKDY